MNIQLNSNLIEDSAKIEMGIRNLQNKMMQLVSRISQEDDGNAKTILNAYAEQIEAMKHQLIAFRDEQKQFNQMTKDAEKEIDEVESELKTILANR